MMQSMVHLIPFEKQCRDVKRFAKWLALQDQNKTALFQVPSDFYADIITAFDPQLSSTFIEVSGDHSPKSLCLRISANPSPRKLPNELKYLERFIITPLRGRKDLIQSLLQRFIKDQWRVKHCALQFLQNFSWPGDLMQLYEICCALNSSKFRGSARQIDRDAVVYILELDTDALRNLVVESFLDYEALMLLRARIKYRDLVRALNRAIFCFALRSSELSAPKLAQKMGIRRSSFYEIKKRLQI